MKHSLKKIFKDWMLVISMIIGAGIYMIYASIPQIHCAGPVCLEICTKLQPWLLFAMLFLSFCKIKPDELRPSKWQMWLLLLQAFCLISLTLLILWSESRDSLLAIKVAACRIYLETALLCLICPTATACAVVTGKLGGNMAKVVSYTILINLLVSLMVPTFIPLIYPQGDIRFADAVARIMGKVFPLLIMPGISAWFVRHFIPRLHTLLLKYIGVSFYIWAFSLTLAVLMSTRAIFHNLQNPWVLLGIALVSLLTCVFQFWAGKKIGGKYNAKTEGGQVLGQKNTVFAIWMGYTFLDPIVSVAGGFYSIWHNCYNTWQLNRQNDSVPL